MMGNDVERILSGINAVKDATISCINSLSDTCAYRLTHVAQHGGLSTAMCYPEEKEVPVGASGFVSPIRSAIETIGDDYNKMNQLAEGLYTNTNSFNNGYGSPWKELNVLNSTISSAESFAGSHPSLQWLGEKAGLLGLLNSILSASIDAKWALIQYHDYIQRGYDNRYNDNNPTITFRDGLNKETIGNLQQNYEENVNIKQPSIDPF